MIRWILIGLILAAAVYLIMKTTGGAASISQPITRKKRAKVKNNPDGTLSVTVNGITRDGVKAYRPLN